MRIAEEILARLRFSNEDTEQIVALVKNHMRFGDILQMRESTLKRFLRLPKFDEHLALHWMDASSAHGDLRLYEFAKERYEATPVETIRPKLLVTGRDLIAAGYRPGPEFKTMLEAAEDAQLEGRVTTTEDGLALVRERFGEPSAESETQAAVEGCVFLAAASVEACRMLLAMSLSSSARVFLLGFLAAAPLSFRCHRHEQASGVHYAGEYCDAAGEGSRRVDRLSRTLAETDAGRQRSRSQPNVQPERPSLPFRKRVSARERCR